MMHPREALYNLVLALGPMPTSNRDDNLSPNELKMKESVDTLKQLVDEYESLDEFMKNPDQLELTF
jgi:hypothetical protein